MGMSEEYRGPRLSYERGTLNQADLHPDPLRLLAQWIEQAEHEGEREPTAMCLSTVDAQGRPHGRMVLLRVLDARGLGWFTHTTSAKGRDLALCPVASVCFWWAGLERQIRVEGAVSLMSAEESDAYFASRPRESQLASAASPQSEPIAHRELLEARMQELAAQYPDAVPRPEHWSGYRLVPDRFEFWQGRASRLHDRFAMTLTKQGWSTQRLAP